MKTPFRPGFKEKWTRFSQNCKMKCHYGDKSLSPNHNSATSLPFYVHCRTLEAPLAAGSHSVSYGYHVLLFSNSSCWGPLVSLFTPGANEVKWEAKGFLPIREDSA